MTSDETTGKITRPHRGPLLAAVIVLAALALFGAPVVHRMYHPTMATVVPPAATRPSTAAAPRTIVFIVPGTYGNEGFWPNIVPGKATFASELQRGLGEKAVIYPCLWYAANDHANREAAAKQLATIIDEKAAGFEKIYLVGHSHGGNVALWAAGMAHHKIDAVICLSTPEVYLQVRPPSGKPLELPVYCPVQTRKNVAKIVTVCPDTDAVPDVWAEAINGVDDNVAIAMTRSWQEQLNHPRLVEDGFWSHGFGDGNVKVVKPLTVADANVTIRSLINDHFGVTPHYAAHSRRMGYVVGSTFRAGCSDGSVHYLKTLIQVDDGDDGGPIDEAAQESWVTKNEPRFTLAGWRLDHGLIELDAKASEAARNSAGSKPEPYLRVQTANDHKILYESETQGRTFSSEWESDFVLWKGPAYLLGVYAQHNLKHDTTLGNRMVKADEAPPADCPVNIAGGIFWSGKFHWTPVHY